MKYLLFGSFALCAVPLTAILSGLSIRSRGIVLACLVFSTVLGDLANINFVSTEVYRGPDRGFEVNLADLLALGLVLGLIARDARRVKWIPYNTVVFLAFAVIGLISAMGSPQPLYSAFTLFKLAKFYLVFWCVVNCLRTGVSRRYIWWGFLGIAGVLTLLALHQKYALGVYRVYGSFDHSNTVPSYANLILPALVVWGLADRDLGRIQSLVTGLAALGLTFTVVATFSRVGMLLAGVCGLGAVAIAVRRAPLSRIVVVSTVGAGVLTIGAAVAADSLMDRFVNAPESSHLAREEFNRAAARMAEDHALGVGINNYSHVLTHTERYNRFIAVTEAEEASGVAHHIYWLTAAETGFLGLAVFLLFIGRFTWHAARYGVFARGPEGLIVGGLFLGLCALIVTGLFEWTFRTTPVLYLFAVSCGCVVAFAETERANRRKRNRAVSLGKQTSSIVAARAA